MYCNAYSIALINTTISAACTLLSCTSAPPTIPHLVVLERPAENVQTASQTVMSEPVGLVYLPEDLLLEIATHISVFDVLSLKQVRAPPSLLVKFSRSTHTPSTTVCLPCSQTCRTLYAFGSTDYLWHRIIQQVDLPLDLPLNTPLCALAQYELQPIVLKAIRLEANWRRRPPRAKAMRLLPRDTNGHYVDDMHFVQGGKWLLTVQRHRQRGGRPGSHLEVWSLEDEPYVIACVDIAGFYRTAALELKEESQYLTLAVGYETDDLIE